MLSLSFGGIEIARDTRMPDGSVPVTAMDAFIAVNNMIGIPVALPVPTCHGERLSLAADPIIKVASRSSNPRLVQPHDPRVAKISCQSVFQEFLAAVRAGVAAEYYPVGTILYSPYGSERPTECWTSEYHCYHSKDYAMPFIVVDYRMAELLNHEKCLAAVLLSMYALERKFVFGRPVSISNIDTMFRNSVIVQEMNRWRSACHPYIHPSLLEVAAKVVVDRAEVQFFPPSLEELHLNPYNNPNLEELTWKYFCDTPTAIDAKCPERTFLTSDGRKTCYWLRSVDQDPFYTYRDLCAAWCCYGDSVVQHSWGWNASLITACVVC